VTDEEGASTSIEEPISEGGSESADVSVPAMLILAESLPKSKKPALTTEEWEAKKAKKMLRGMMIGITLFIVLLIVGLVIFFTITKAPTENAVARGVATPDGSLVDLEEGRYDVWAPEGFWGTADVIIETMDGRQVFRSQDSGIDTNVQGYTKLGTFDANGGTYVIYADYTEVVISNPTGALCTTCIAFIIIMIISVIYAFIMLLGWSKAKNPPRPVAYPPPQAYPPPGHPPQQRPPPGYPPQQPPPGHYPPQQPPPGQYPQQQPGIAQYPPGAPSAFSANKGEDSITLLWEPPSDQGSLPVSKIKVFRGLEPKGMMAIAEVPADSNEYVDRTVEVGTTYYYRLAAISGAGEGRRTPALKATIFAQEE
jgi:hypothetical protein